jgi:hypothetical protein
MFALLIIFVNHSIGFREKRQFFRGILAKIAENCDHNIDPGRFRKKYRPISSTSSPKLFHCTYVNKETEIVIRLFDKKLLKFGAHEDEIWTVGSKKNSPKYLADIFPTKVAPKEKTLRPREKFRPREKKSPKGKKIAQGKKDRPREKSFTQTAQFRPRETNFAQYGPTASE